MTTKTFIFKHEPAFNLDEMLDDFEKSWKGELKSVEPHIMRSNSVDALLSGVTRERLELFQTLSKKRPDSLEQLANYLQRDYEEVKKDAEILASWGIIKLPKQDLKEKPVVLYDRIVLETQDQVFLIAETFTKPEENLNHQILIKPKEPVGKIYIYDRK